MHVIESKLYEVVNKIAEITNLERIKDALQDNHNQGRSLSYALGSYEDRELFLRIVSLDTAIEAMKGKIASEKSNLHALQVKALDELIRATATNEEHKGV